MKRTSAALLGLALVAGAFWWAAAPRNPAPRTGPDLASMPPGPEVSTSPAAGVTGASLGDVLGGESLEAQTPEDVRAVVRFCREAELANAEELLRVARRSPDPLVAANALGALGRLGVLDAASLQPFLGDERPRVRQAAIVALATAEREEAVQRLVGYVRPDADPTERSLAIRALGQVGGPRASAALATLDEDRGLTEVDRVFLRSARRAANERGRTPSD